MSYPVWPEELVQFERSGWQSQRQDGRRRSQSEAGPPSFRRRFSSTARRVDLTLAVDANGRQIFDRFYDDDCAGGVGYFWMPDPSRHGLRLLSATGASLLTADGRPILIASRWLCTWGDEPPVESIVGDIIFRIGFSVWVMP